MSQAQPAAPQWWLMQDGAPAGPFAHLELIGQLNSGQITLNALASPVGSTAWRTLRDWGCFSTFSGVSGSRQSSPQDIDTSASRQPRLPDMANCLSVYGLFINPVLWLINTASCVASTPLLSDASPLQGLEVLMYLVSFLVTVVSGSLLFLGALYLRQRKRAGIPCLIAGLSVDVAWFVVTLVVLVVLLGAAAAEPGVEHVNNVNNGASGIEAALCGVSLAAGIFELVALVWLLTKGKELNLR